MPIRTDRGRTAALRRFWSWPIQSPAHLVGTAAGAILLITGVACSVTALDGDQPPSSSAAAPTASSAPTTSSALSTSASPRSSAPSTSTTAPPASVSTPPTTVGTTADGPAGALTTARGFMQRWVRPPSGVGHDQWAGGVRPYVMPESQLDLEQIDPANIPATKLTGDPTAVSTAESVVEADVPTDAGTIRVVVVAQPNGRWLVRTWDLAG